MFIAIKSCYRDLKRCQKCRRQAVNFTLHAIFTEITNNDIEGCNRLNFMSFGMFYYYILGNLEVYIDTFRRTIYAIQTI